MADIDKVMQILRTNANKTFVKRILNPEKFPKLDLGNGGFASHKMAWGEVGGGNEPVKYIVYPTVLFDGKKLVDYGDAAFDQVMKTGNFIEFDTPEEADWFSRNYKLAWHGARNASYE